LRQREEKLLPESIVTLFAWLDPDRERAAIKYHYIRNVLIKHFSERGYDSPVEFADSIISQVTKNIAEVPASYKTDPAPYFLDIAQRTGFVREAKESKSIPKAEMDQLEQIAEHVEPSTGTISSAEFPVQILTQPDKPFFSRIFEIAKERFIETFDHSIGLVFAILSVALTHFLLALIFDGNKDSLEYRGLRLIIFSGEAALILKFIWNALRGFSKNNE
jgi:hypothetical protein